jgi:hypothetical protein
VHDLKAKGLYYKNMTTIEQDTYPKLTINKLKVMWDSTSIYTHWAPSSKNFSKNFLFTCGPCSSMWELIVNYESSKNELEIKEKLTMK